MIDQVVELPLISLILLILLSFPNDLCYIIDFFFKIRQLSYYNNLVIKLFKLILLASKYLRIPSTLVLTGFHLWTRMLFILSSSFLALSLMPLLLSLMSLEATTSLLSLMLQSITEVVSLLMVVL